MGWQAEIFARLRDREWRQLGLLFEAIEPQIPLHIAMRYAMNPRRKLFSEMPTATQARWVVFLHALSEIGVEGSGGWRSRKWSDQVRLRYVAERSCAACGGPVIKSTWMARTGIVCLACETGRPILNATALPEVLPAPVPHPQPAPQPVVVVAHAVLRQPIEEVAVPRRRRQSERHRAKMQSKQKSRRVKVADRHPLGAWYHQIVGWLQRWAANNPPKARGPPLGGAIKLLQ